MTDTRVAKGKAAKKDARNMYKYMMAQEAAERELVNLEQGYFHCYDVTISAENTSLNSEN